MAKVEDFSRGLTDRQMRFVTEYLKDCNGRQAAIRAGYSIKTSGVQASRLLTNANVQKEIKIRQDALREKEETVSERIRRRLWEESEDYSEFSSHSARIRALEILAKIHGEFALDNRQKGEGAAEFLRSIKAQVVGVAKERSSDDED